MLDARRTERNYLLVYDPASLQAARESLDKIEQILIAIRELNPADQELTQQALNALHQYRQRFETAVTAVGQPRRDPPGRGVGVGGAGGKNPDNTMKIDGGEETAQRHE